MAKNASLKKKVKKFFVFAESSCKYSDINSTSLRMYFPGSVIREAFFQAKNPKSAPMSILFTEHFLVICFIFFIFIWKIRSSDCQSNKCFRISTKGNLFPRSLQDDFSTTFHHFSGIHYFPSLGIVSTNDSDPSVLVAQGFSKRPFYNEIICMVFIILQLSILK